MRFLAGESEPHPFASLVFVWREKSLLVCDIEGRGWCVPSGRLEAGESPAEAAIRETREESGYVLRSPRQFGYFLIRDTDGHRVAACFVGEVEEPPMPIDDPASRGVTWMRREELAARYYLHNSEVQAAFDQSFGLSTG